MSAVGGTPSHTVKQTEKSSPRKKDLGLMSRFQLRFFSRNNGPSLKSDLVLAKNV